MTTGVMPLEDLKPQMVANTAFFETSQTVYPNAYGITSGNWDGAGMSLGALQINFGQANRLSPYFQHMINNYDSFCHDLWINNGLTETDYSNWKTLMLGNDLAAKHAWADSISDPGIGVNGRAKGDLMDPYVEIFRQMGVHQGSIDKQVEISETYYMPNAFKIFNQMSCNSRLALASFYDLSINRGRCWPMNLIQIDFDSIDANGSIDATEKERQKIYQINYRGCWDNNNSAAGEIDHWETTDGAGGYTGRRKLMADQGGSYFGTIYDPDVQFQMTQDIAVEEKAIHDLKLGNVDIKATYLGLVECSKIYRGTEMVYAKAYKTNEAPQTGFRKLKNYFTDLTGSVSMAAGEKLWIDVKNWIACRTYYTTDGSTPTTASTLYTNALTFNNSCTLKTLTVSVEGIAEAVKTLTVDVVSVPETSITPTATVQNTIPFTVTLSATNSPTATYYKLGTTGTQQTYTGPFTVNQNSPGVASYNIKVTYWSVNANGTEPEKSIIYDTSGSQPGTPVVTVTNGVNQVKLDWAPTANTTSYTVYRSTTAGTQGAFLTGAQYITANTWTDTTAAAGTTYYYTVRAGNYSLIADSAQVTGIPTAAATKPTYRYIRIDGWGEYNAGTPNANFRPVGLEVWSGGVDRLNGKTGTSEGGVDFMAPAGFVTSGTNTVTWMTDHGATVPSATTNYAGYWDALNANGNAFIKFDMGAAYPIDSIKYWNYSASGVQKSQRFKVYGTNNLANFGTSGALIGTAGVDYELLFDYSTNQTVFPLTPNHFVTKAF